MLPQLEYVAVTTLVGWLALWPARRSLGRTGYHVAAFPVGLLGWAFVAIVSLSLRMPYSWPLAIVSLGVFCAGLAALAALAARSIDGSEAQSPQPSPTPWWSYAITAAILGGATAIIAAWGVSTYSHDGWAQYELYSWLLHDSGFASSTMLGHRMLLPTAFHAAFHMFGGEFSGFVYPILSLHVATLVGISAYRAARPVRRGIAVAAAVAVATTMVAHVTYLFMTIYVHSHMPTAIFLLLAGYAIWRAAEHLPDVEAEHDDLSAPPLLKRPWLLVAGLAMAGVWLSRPDGPAYAMSAVLLFSAVVLTTGVRRKDSYLFFTPVLVLSSAYTLATVLNRGWWTSPKIDALMLVEFIGLYAFIWLALWLLPVRRIPWITSGRNFLRLVLAIEVIALVWAFRVLGLTASATVLNIVVNLLQQGGWRSFWPLMLAMITISVVLYVRTGRVPFTTNALFYVSQFFVIALFVHGFTHPGRLGWGDSFNRVAFHAVPLLYWYLGLYVGGLLKAVSAPDTVGVDQ